MITIDKAFETLAKGIKIIVTGIKVIKISKKSKAYYVGIRPNDIILSVNNIPVQKIKDLEIVAGQNDSELIVHVQRGNRTAFLLLK